MESEFGGGKGREPATFGFSLEGTGDYKREFKGLQHYWVPLT